MCHGRIRRHRLAALGTDATEDRLPGEDGVSTREAFGRKFLEVEPCAPTLLAAQGVRDIAHLLRPATRGSCTRPGHRRRMDSYVEQFQAAGGSPAMLANGNRARAPWPSHAKSTAAAISARSAARLRGWRATAFTRVEVLECPELGMEAVWRIEVHHFPAFVIIDDKGNDFFAQGWQGTFLTIQHH